MYASADKEANLSGRQIKMQEIIYRSFIPGFMKVKLTGMSGY